VLGQAAAYTNDKPGLLFFQFSQATQFTVYFVGCLLAHAAGVKQNDIGILGSIGWKILLFAQQSGNPF
jgi:hypothetical protein